MNNLHRIAHRTTLLLLGFFLFLSLQGVAVALDVPPLKGRVNDYASMLSAATVTQMEQSLKQFELDQSTQIVVLTIPSLENDSLEVFSIKVAEAWKIGQKGLDNGAILLVARNERKVRIEVGYGLEGSLTDLTSGRIIRGVIVPHFKKGDFDGGIMAGLNTMMGAVRGEFSAEDVPRKSSGEGDSDGFLFMLIMMVFFIGKVMGDHKIIAASVSGFLTSLFGLLVLGPKLLFIILLFPVGFIGGLIASSFTALQMGSRSVRGGGYIGGGGFGGGGFGGGFGGGGGGFGGGGASGGW